MFRWQTQSCKHEEVTQYAQIDMSPFDTFHSIRGLLCSKNFDLLVTARLGSEGFFVLETSVGPVRIRRTRRISINTREQHTPVDAPVNIRYVKACTLGKVNGPLVCKTALPGNGLKSAVVSLSPRVAQSALPVWHAVRREVP